MTDTSLLIDAINKLSLKLGEGAASLYNSFLMQVKIDLVWDVFMVLLFSVIIFLLLKASKCLVKKLHEEDREFTSFDDGRCFAVVALWILIVICSAIIACNICCIITYVVNPQYAAIIDMLNNVSAH